MTLYESIAQEIIERIAQGFYQVGSKLPSIRKMSEEYHVSISTVQEAYRLLEEQQKVAARPKSGYYVLGSQETPNLPSVSRPIQRPLKVSRWELVVELLSNHDKHTFALGRGTPDLTSSTLRPLFKIVGAMSRRQDIANFSYDSLQGPKELRVQIARLMVDSGCRLHPDDIITTTGCQEALTCSLLSLVTAGDIIAIDSPSFYGSMQAIQAIQALGLKVLEIPTDPQTGISLAALELALEQWPIKILQLTPTCNNPLGYTMPDGHKKALIELANQYDIAIIEDDIYGDLSYSHPRPRSIKSFDTEGRVLFCSSFSKTISPAFRTGWCAPGQWLQQVKHMKYVSTASASILQPRAISEFIAQGYYERHLRRIREQYLRNRDIMIDWVKRFFPEGTKMTYPQGGFMLWVELPKIINTEQLSKEITQYDINIAPGILFTASNKYQNCLRINYSQEPSHELQNAIEIIGNEAKRFVLM